jgi:hypothetical protein
LCSAALGGKSLELELLGGVGVVVGVGVGVVVALLILYY